MAEQGGSNLTLADLLKRQDPDGGLAMIGDMMSQDQEVLKVIPWKEANNTTGHRITVDNSLPSGTWRRLNQGVADEKSTTVQIEESVGQLATWLTTDKTLAELSDDPNTLMAEESQRAVEGLSQTMATSLIYADSDTDPEKFMGLSPRYDDTSAANGVNIIDEGDSSNLSSIWLINWSPTTVYGIYPKGTQSGLQTINRGLQEVSDGTNDFLAYRTYLEWNFGIAVKDWRHVVRIANIDTNALVKDAATGPDLVDLLDQAIEQIRNTNGTPTFLCSKAVRKFLRRQAKNHTNVRLTLEDFDGRAIPNYDGIPILRTDAITNSETAVS